MEQLSIRLWNPTRRLRKWLDTREGRLFALLLGAALLIRLIPAAFPGYFDDLQGFVDSGRAMDQHFWTFYSASSAVNPPPAYPPLAEYLFGLLTAAYAGLAHLLGLQPVYTLTRSPLLAVIMKLPIVGADVAAVCVVYALGREVVGRRWAFVAAAAYAFSPTILFDGAIWGQVDGWYTLAVLLAFIFTARQQGLSAGIWFGIAVMLKVQPVVLGPLILLYLLRWAGWRQALRALAGMAGVSAVSFLPYLPRLQTELLAFGAHLSWVVRTWPFASVSAYNLWWFLGDPYHVYTAPYSGALSPNTIGWGLFTAVALIVAAGIWRDCSAERLFLGAALLVTAFFMLTTLQRERYIYPALVLFLAAAIYNSRNVLFFAIVSITSLLNLLMAVVGNPVFSHPGLDVGALATFLGQHFVYSRAVAGANMCLLLSVAAAFVMSALSAGAQARQPGAASGRVPAPTEYQVTSER